MCPAGVRSHPLQQIVRPANCESLTGAYAQEFQSRVGSFRHYGPVSLNKSSFAAGKLQQESATPVECDLALSIAIRIDPIAESARSSSPT